MRKTLGQHEIATVQTTAIDRDAGFIHLTTLLAHSSGEWLSSDWPVCPINETNAPHRMGAALTYARRYVLFTLVGITGEDDLDAPDLRVLKADDTGPAVGSDRPTSPAEDGAPGPSSQAASRRKPSRPAPSNPVLSAKESADARELLLSEMAPLAQEDDLDRWALDSLRTKNTLTANDARHVEQAFEAKLAGHDRIKMIPSSPISPIAAAKPELEGIHQISPSPDSGTDKSQLTLSEPRRVRDKAHLRFVARQPCLICGLRFAQ